jgi:poly(3-hydroxybutyrate) depolymerase
MFIHTLGPSCQITSEALGLTVSNRSVLIYQPSSAAARIRQGGKVAAIIALRYSSGDLEGTRCTYHLEPFADAHGFMVVYPETQHGANDTTWGYQTDLTFFSTLITQLETDFGLDRRRAYAVGWSSGGSFALFLQNEVDMFDAVASVAGQPCRLSNWTQGRFGHRTMVVWNTKDPELNYPSCTTDLNVFGQDPSKQARNVQQFSTSWLVDSAEVQFYPEDSHAELIKVNWSFTWFAQALHYVASSEIIWSTCHCSLGYHLWGHTWPTAPISFNVAQHIVNFFLNGSPLD